MNMEELYDKIYRFCYYRLLNREMAEDLTQETFLRYFSGNYREEGKEIRYLYTIARNLCIEEYRKRKMESLPETVSDEGEQSEKMLERVHIRDAIMKLHEDDRDLLVMRFLNETSISEISRITGLSRFALYRKLKRLKREFCRLMEGETENE